MPWRGATRERNGVVERRCAKRTHPGARWLPFTAEHFYMDGKCYWCRPCQRAYMRDRWRTLHPMTMRRGALKKVVKKRERAAKSAGTMLQHITAGWGKP